MFQKRKLFLWIFVGAVLLLVSCLAYYYFANKSEPVIKVVVRNPGVLIFAGNEEYYTVLLNGQKQKIGTFNLINIESYRVDEHNTESDILIDNIRGTHIKRDSPLYEIAYNIIELIAEVKGLKNPDISVLYILGDRYFFDVFDERHFLFSGFYDTIFEYLPDEKRIVKIAEFKSKNIEHIELYKTE